MMSSNPELTADKGAKTDAAKVVERSGFGLFGTLPFLGMGSKKDTPAEPMDVDKKQKKVGPPESTKPVSNQPTIAEIPNHAFQATVEEKGKPSVEGKSVTVATKTVSVKFGEPETNPSASSQPTSQATHTGTTKIPTQNKNVDKTNPAVETKRIDEVPHKAPAKQVVVTTEVDTNLPGSIKPSSRATITEKTQIAAQSATVGKVKPARETMPVDEVGENISGVEPSEVMKPNSSKPAEEVKPAEQTRNKETKKPTASSSPTETLNHSDMKEASEIIKPVENSMADYKVKTCESSEGADKPVDQAAHSLGGESANQFTPPLPEDFLKKAEADAIGSNIPSRVNSQIPSAKLLEGKTEDLLLAPIIPRPRKRPAAKSLLKQLGHSRSLKKVKMVKPKPENKPAARVKSPGRGRAKQSKSPAAGSPSSKKAKLISEGPPAEALEGGWPEGWIRRVFERVSGATKGTSDKYWYSPINGVRLRSIVEVRRFMKALEKTKGDENEAKKIMKTITL